MAIYGAPAGLVAFGLMFVYACMLHIMAESGILLPTNAHREGVLSAMQLPHQSPSGAFHQASAAITDITIIIIQCVRSTMSDTYMRR